MTYAELMVAARNATPTPGIDRTIRDLMSENGILLQIILGLIEYRDGLVEHNVHVDLTTTEGHMKALKTQGLVQGVDTCLSLIHQMSIAPAEEPSR